jgi:transposase
LLSLVETVKLPGHARGSIDLHAEQFRDTRTKIGDVTAEIRTAVAQDEVAQRLQTIAGVGPIPLSVLAATLSDVTGFRSTRDLAAWIGLTPKPNSSGGKERFGAISKMGNRYIRRRLYLGAMARIAARKERGPGDDWLWSLLERKPIKLVAIALANRMARTVWALIRTGESYGRVPA